MSGWGCPWGGGEDVGGVGEAKEGSASTIVAVAERSRRRPDEGHADTRLPNDEQGVGANRGNEGKLVDSSGGEERG